MHNLSDIVIFSIDFFFNNKEKKLVQIRFLLLFMCSVRITVECFLIYISLG